MHGLLLRAKFRRVARGARDSQDWWHKRLLEELTEVRLAVVIDDADELVGERGGRIVAALAALAQRRTGCASRSPASRAPSPDRGPVGQRGTAHPAAGPVVARGLAVDPAQPARADALPRDLRGFYSDLSHLEQWEQLATELEESATPSPAIFPTWSRGWPPPAWSGRDGTATRLRRRRGDPAGPDARRAPTQAACRHSACAPGRRGRHAHRGPAGRVQQGSDGARGRALGVRRRGGLRVRRLGVVPRRAHVAAIRVRRGRRRLRGHRALDGAGR